MTGEELLRIADELEAYYEEFDDCFTRREGRGLIRVFGRGQLGPLERKSLEPIADREGVSARVLQGFFSRSDWDEDKALERHQKRVAAELGGRMGSSSLTRPAMRKRGTGRPGCRANTVAKVASSIMASSRCTPGMCVSSGIVCLMGSCSCPRAGIRTRLMSR